MTHEYRRLATIGLMAGLLLCLALPSLAQDEQLALYDEGSFAFDYDQWPWGSYGGEFSATGALLDTLLWGTDQLESCGGSMEVISDTTLAWCYGAVYNTDGTSDFAAVLVRSAGDLTPGTYNVDIENFMAGFVYFDDVSDFTIPADPGDLAEFLASIVADHKFMPLSGSIHVSALSDTIFAGTFDGMMADLDDITFFIEITNGVFEVRGDPLLTSTPSANPLLLAHGSHPNPFNPDTRLRFSLAEESAVKVEIYDPAGRRVDILLEERLPAGDHSLDWRAIDGQGRPVSAGLYLYRIVTEKETGSGKMLLLP